MPKRYIPAKIKRQLRREVNWGCPVAGCGNPFFICHHFAPPFRNFTKHMEHDSNGMIALCLPHAAQADGGVFTLDQFREMKLRPFLNGEFVSGRNHWLRRNIVLRSGSNTFVNISTLLTVDGKKVIWFSRNSEGYQELSMDLRDSRGYPLFLMENNDWLVSGPLNDLQATPRGRDIVIKSQVGGFWMTLRFDDLEKDVLRSQIEDRAVEGEQRQLAQQNATLALLRARFPDAINLPTSMFGDEIATREEAWAPFEKVISEWPALEITFEGQLPPPVQMLSTARETNVMGITMTGPTIIGPSTVFSFSGG